ncbi:thrombospondin type 3 repeat-containing protein [Agromyces zhanjiangensis]|uniref:thrombospondin type 3 repeat-containing protein n=1 Tax=Agromyces zhanjiangensis TaxID=3158562 RepID=UPI003F512410
MVAAVFLSGGVAHAPAHAEGETDPLAPWALTARVEYRHVTDRINHTRLATFIDSDSESMNFEFTASETYSRSPSCPDNGLPGDGGENYSGSVSGTGYYSRSFGFPSEWTGLPPAISYTGLYTNPTPSTFARTGTIGLCGSSIPLNDFAGTVLTEVVLLPGTDELEIASPGTTLDYTYTKQSIDGQQTWSVSVYAVKLGAGPDLDGDLIIDSEDNCPADANADQADLDGDGLGDACDSDIDQDGIPNDLEVQIGSSPFSADTDGDGIGDSVETNGGQWVDTDGDGTPDAADEDSDDDGIPDVVEGVPDWRVPAHAVVDGTLVGIYSFTGEPFDLAGGLTARVTGAASEDITALCISSQWTARAQVKEEGGTVGFYWNDQIAAGWDLDPDSESDQVQSLGPGSYVGPFYDEAIQVTWCRAPSTITNGIVAANFNMPLSLTSSHTVVSLSHRATVWAQVADQVVASVELGKSTSREKKDIRWTKQTSIDFAY